MFGQADAELLEEGFLLCVGRGNPAQPIATVEFPLRQDVSVKQFAKGLKPIRAQSSQPTKPLEKESS